MSIADVKNNHKVLVELSVIPSNGKSASKDLMDYLWNDLENNGLLFIRNRNGASVEGEWKQISPLLYACYERVTMQFPTGFLKISIR